VSMPQTAAVSHITSAWSLYLSKYNTSSDNILVYCYTTTEKNYSYYLKIAGSMTELVK
jgi:hypothetical protein